MMTITDGESGEVRKEKEEQNDENMGWGERGEMKKGMKEHDGENKG